MPVDRKLFEIAKDPSQLIIEFLKKEPEKAFSISDIANEVKEIKDLGIPTQTINDTLDMLVRNGDVEVAWLKDKKGYKSEPFYAYKDKMSLFS